MEAGRGGRGLGEVRGGLRRAAGEGARRRGGAHAVAGIRRARVRGPRGAVLLARVDGVPLGSGRRAAQNGQRRKTLEATSHVVAAMTITSAQRSRKAAALSS